MGRSGVGARPKGIMRGWVSAAALVAVLLLAVGPAEARGLVPPAAPAANIPPVPDFNGPCFEINGMVVRGDCAYTHGVWVMETAKREQDALLAIDAARKKEDLGPLALPRDWKWLTPAEQQFVLVDLERVDRGLPPIAGLAHALDAVARAGSARFADPSGAGTRWAADHWAGNFSSDREPAAAMYFYMYEDGWGGSLAKTLNVVCGAADAPGCWGHRFAILGNWGTDAAMGIYVPASGNGYTTQFFVQGAASSLSLYYTWTEALRDGADRPVVKKAAAAA